MSSKKYRHLLLITVAKIVTVGKLYYTLYNFFMAAQCHLALVLLFFPLPSFQFDCLVHVHWQ